MRADEIRVFIPSKDYNVSQSFYQALGFSMDYVSEDLSLFENGDCVFFLQRFYNHDLANNLVFQLVVVDINEAYERITSVAQTFDVRFRPIQEQPWGKVVFLWGPSGELWQVTELNPY